MLVLSVLRQNGLKRVLSSPNRAIIVQRSQTRNYASNSAEVDEFIAMTDREDSGAPPDSPVHWQLRAPTSSELPHSLTPDAEVSNNTTSLKRADSLWKVGAPTSPWGRIENKVTNAVNIGLVMHRWSCYQTFDPLARANSFAPFLKTPYKWTSPSLTPQSISEFKKRMEQYGYANDMVLPYSNYLIHLINTDRFVLTTVHASA
jgi:hypothetical protein